MINSNMWNQQYQQATTPPVKDEPKSQQQQQQFQQSDTKVRTSIGSCGDDSGVVNNISSEGTSSSSNTPPTVYRSPTSADNSTIYPAYFTANPAAAYYYSQNYMIPAKNMNTSADFDTENLHPHHHSYNPYVQQLKATSAPAFIDESYHANQFYAAAAGKLHQDPLQPTAYYNNVNVTYNYGPPPTGYVAKAPITTSSPIPAVVAAPTTTAAPQLPPPSSLPVLPANTTNLNNNPNIKVKLQDMSLWKSFNEIGTEMIITKSGRRMFPSLRMSVSGLEANSKYIMFIDVVPYDDNRYKYHNCEWIISGKAEPHFGGRAYLHPDSPMSGSQWMKQVISFHKLKLTNNPLDRLGHIVLNSMHKYIPRIHIVEEGKSLSTFTFNETVFTAVTAYQNERITKLKIEYNPFAKGFRDGQGRKDYRAKRNADDEVPYEAQQVPPPPSIHQHQAFQVQHLQQHHQQMLHQQLLQQQQQHYQHHQYLVN